LTRRAQGPQSGYDERMTVKYDALVMVGTEEAGDKRWQSVRYSDEPGDAPFLFCEHAHKTYAEAAACREYGRTDD
jgi:hypothetical protein